MGERKGGTLGRSRRALRASTSLASLLLAGVVAVVTAHTARGGTIWVGGTSGDYNTSANWSPADVPDSLGETAEFGNSTRTTISETGGKSIDAFQFDAGAPSYTVNLDPGGFGFVLSGAGIVNNSGVTQTINVSSPALALENSASLGDGNVIVNLTGTGQIDLDGTSTGGLATVNMNSANGILITGDNHSLSIGALNGSSGVVQFSGANQSLTVGGNNASTSLAARIIESGGTGSLTKVGVGTLTLSGSNSYSLGTTISGGSIWAANANALGTGNVTIGNGYLRATVDFSVPGSTFTFQDGSTSTVGAAAGKTLTIAPPGGISVATGAIHFGAINSTGTVVLGQQASGGLGNPDFFVDAGTLKFAANWATGGFLQSAGLTVASGATLDMNGTDSGVWGLSGGGTITNNAAGTTADIGVFGSFPGSFKDGAGTVSLTASLFGVLTLSGTNTYSGTTTIYGALKGGATNAFSAASAVTVNSGGTLDLGGFHQTIGSLSGSGTVTNSGAVAAILTTNGDNSSTTFSGLIEDGTGGIALVKDGTGTLTLSTANTYSLGTTINAGVLAADNGGALGASFVKFAGNSTLALGFNGTLANDIDVAAGVSPTIADGANDVTLAGQMAYLGGAGTTLHFGKAGDTGVFTLSPSLFLSDPNGKWSLDGGNLVIGNGNAAGLLGGLSAANLAARTILDLSGNAFELVSPTGSGEVRNYSAGPVTLSLSGNSTFAGSIESIVSPIVVSKIGAGTITLSGVNSYTGITNILDGTLALSGGGSIAGSSGVSLNAGGTFDISQTNAGASIRSLSGDAGSSIALGSKTLSVTNAGGTTFAGVISDGGLGAGTGGGLTLAGGSLTLTGSNTFTGLTTINAGAVLTLGSGGDLAGAVANNSGLTVSGAGGSTVGGLLANGATLLVNAGATLTASAGIDNASGASIFNFGTLNDDLDNAGTVNNDGAYNADVAGNSGTINNNPGATWTGDLLHNATGTVNNTITATWIGNATNDGGTINNNGTWTGAISNAGTFNNTGTGIVNGALINSGTVNASGAINGAIANQTGGAFTVTGALVASLFNFTNDSGATLSVTGGDFTGAAALTNDGTVSVATTRTMVVLGLTGTNAAAAIGVTGTGTFVFGGGNFTDTYAGRFTGNGLVVKGGTGAETLTGANGAGSQFAGTFDIDGGTLLVDGTLGDTAGNAATVHVNSDATLGGHGTVAGAVTVFSGGTLSAGASPGTLTVASLTLNAGSTSDFELGQAGVPGGANNDLVIVNGNATLGGTLNLTDVGGGQVQSGYYNLIQVGGTVSGSFATVNAGAATADIYTTTGGGPFNINALINAPGQFVQFWDGADETGGVSGLAGGTGTWDGARTNWTTNPDGSDPLNPAGATVNDHWREGVGIFAVTGGTVTTAGALNFQGLQFIVDGYTVNGPGTLNMTGDAPGGTPTQSFVNVEGAGNTATISAVISGNAGVGLSKAGAGTLVLSGANTYDGGTTITAGTLRLTGVGTLGATTASTTVDGASAVLDLGGTTQTQATVSLVDGAIQNGTLNAMTSFTQSGGTMAGAANVPTYSLTGGTLSGTVTASTLFDLQSGLVTGHLAGAAPLVKSGPGTVTLEGASSYTGGTSVQAGTLVGNAASIRGDIANDATVVFNQASDAAFAGNIGGTGAMVKGGLGALTLAGTSTLGWQVLAGGLTSAAGRFTGDVAIGSGASFTFDQAADAAYAGTISGDGAFFKIGAARATLTGNSSGFSGATTVAAGTLSVNGTLGGTLAVLSGGRLQGSGTVGPTTIASGGIIAPGNSIGTLKINGDITFQSGSIYEVEINAGLQSDRVDASGVAAIKGGTVDVIKAAGVYTPGSRWTIVSAGGGVTGTFATFTQNMPFVDLLLAYDADHVYIESRRNTAQFCDVARTSNQCATANAVASLGQGNTVYDAVSALPDDQSARAAFDSLSGELHASTKSAFIEDSRFVREAATDRVRAAFEGIAVRSTPVMAYSEKGFAPAPADTERPAVWMRGFGSWGAWQGDGNAAKLDRSIGGVFFGADGLVTENLRLGLLAGFSHSNFDVGARASSGSSEDYHLGFYGGSQWGALGLRFGAAYAWHDIETARSVAFPGFADRLSADYLAATAQVFGELGYRFDTPGASFEPFAGLAYVNLHTDGFSEQGGVAALTSASTNTGVTFTTLGLRASTDFIVDGTKATARGMLGWRHAFGDTTPLSNFVFAGGGSAFTIAGVPLGKDAAVIETGFDFAIAANATLGLSYSGQIADGVQDHGFRADLKVNF